MWCVVVIGKDADPLSVQALDLGVSMAVLLIILFITIALAIRAGVWKGRLSPAGDSVDETGLVDTCARTFALVLMSLVGLFALGVTYGNVLGAGAP
jgi:hypothetical protein